MENKQSSSEHKTNLITVQITSTPHCAARPPQTPQTKQVRANKLHHYLSLLRSHSSCASRRILSSSPCRAVETLSCGPVKLSLRLTAAISSSSSTQEPDKEKGGQAEFVLTLRCR